MNSPLIDALGAIRNGITTFMQILRQNRVISREEVHSVVNPIMTALNQIAQITSSPIAEDLSSITRQTIAACIKIVKIYQTEGDLETAQLELQQIGSQFNRICREFSVFARDYDIYTEEIEDNSFSIQLGALTFITNSTEMDQVLSIPDRPIALTISDNQEPSLRIRQTFEELSRKHNSVIFGYVDLDRATGLDDLLLLPRFPHFKFYSQGGRLIKELSGASDQLLRTTCAQLFASPSPSQPSQGPPAFVPYTGKNKIHPVPDRPYYDQKIADPSHMLVVFFTEQNPVCNAAKNLFAELVEPNTHVEFLMVDCALLEKQFEDVLAEFPRLPHWRFYKEAKMIKEFGGQFQENTLRAAFATIIAKEKAHLRAAQDGGIAHSKWHKPGHVLKVTADEVYTGLLQLEDTLVVINFYNHEKISQDMIPVFADLATHYPQAIFVSVDVNASRAKVRACASATRLPAFRFFKNGDRLKEWQGKDKEYLEALIKQFLK
eukprot:TRINITY_DN17847_c0_g1_i1.p1 TRINITY_DN17847_c0_g1~~TRINITY_DN17847_c0_g1_i1.p1  ORF type:complete len:491 (+),score=92.69 TRINITY_DN17847_c0_g1_i1:28-1500(+)